MSEKVVPVKMLRFKLLASKHTCPDARLPKKCPMCAKAHPDVAPAECECGFVPKREKFWDVNVRTYFADGSGAGNIIETTQDLTKLNGSTIMHRKFELLTEDATPTIKREFTDIGEMTFDELKDYAESEEFDLKGAKTADEARKLVREYRKSRKAAMQPA